MAAILLNTVCMCLEHFEGFPVEVDVPHAPADHCCNRDCSVRSASDCPRGFSLKAEEWETFQVAGAGGEQTHE